LSTYVIGDVQGCYGDLVALLEKIRFDPTQDRLWLTGDLVNRGPQSLAVLRYVRQLGKSAVVVLGNHDLHLLACRMVPAVKPRRRDTLDDILRAPDCDELLDWLRCQPLLHHDVRLGLTMVHAGLPPQWRLEDAISYASEVEILLRNNTCSAFLAAMYGDLPNRWSNDLAGMERSRFIVNCLTRMRFLTREGDIELRAKGAPDRKNNHLLPWFAVPMRHHQDEKIVFGHWSTLHLSSDDEARYNVVALDTGAVWGGELTAWCVETNQRFQVSGSTPVPLDE